MNHLSQPSILRSKFGNPVGQTGQIIGIIQGGINIGQQLGGGSGTHAPACHAPSGCFQCQMNGQGDIAGCLDALDAQYHQAEHSGATPSQLLQLATVILQAVSNPAYLKQTDSYVQSFKDVYQRAIARLQSQGATLNGSGGTSVNPLTGQPITATGSIPSSYLLIGGIALVGLVLVIKK